MLPYTVSVLVFLTTHLVSICPSRAQLLILEEFESRQHDSVLFLFTHTCTTAALPTALDLST